MKLCKDCKWSALSERAVMAELEAEYECHYNPPAFCGTSEMVYSGWPSVMPDSFCSKFEEKDK